MNFQDLKQKNKKNKITITALVLVLVIVILFSSLLLISNGFTTKPQFWFKKELPRSTYVLGLTSFDELVGIPFDKEAFSFVGTGKDMDEKTYAWSIINLAVDGFGDEFVPPDEGDYKISFRLNDIYYEANSEVDLEEQIWTFSLLDGKKVVGFLRFANYAYLRADGSIFVDMNLDDENIHLGDNTIIPGYSIQIYYYCDANEIYDFELLSFEKVE